MPQLTEKTFNEVINSSTKPALILYSTGWCAASKVFQGLLHSTITAYEDYLDFHTVDIDQERPLTDNQGIRGVPALVVYKDGEKQVTKIGACTEEELREFLDGYK